MSDRVSMVRLAKACAIVAFAIAVPAAASIAASPAADVGESSPHEPLNARAAIGDGDPDGFLDRIEQAAFPGDDALPPSFEAEAGIPEGCDNVRANADGSVVGCSLSADAETAFSKVSALMQMRGYREIPLSGLIGATYIKEGGTCPWILVTCTQTGRDAEIVYRIARP